MGIRTEGSIALRNYEKNLEHAQISTQTKMQMMQSMQDQESADASNQVSVAMVEIYKESAQKQASSMKNPASLAMGIGGGLFGLYAGASAVPGMNKYGINAKLFNSANQAGEALQRTADQANKFFGAGAQAFATAGKITDQQLEADRTIMRAEQQEIQSLQQKETSAKHRKLQQRDQNSNAVTQTQNEEFQVKRAMVQ